MVFSSEVFLFLFLPVTYLLYLAIPKLRARNILLIIVSLVFYAYGEPAAVLLMILSVICNYFFGRAMTNERCKKPVLIANVAGFAADTVFGFDLTQLSIGAAWIGAVCYTVQIYFDFSGYSDMAIGLGKMFGFTFKENFNYPLAAGCMTDFWRKWNISVSTWFKEYVYIPLGGNRKGKHRTVVNKMIVFLLTGIWHGANLTFVMWGVLHGLLLLAESYTALPARLTKNRFLTVLGHVYTLFFVILAFVLFRADTIGDGLVFISRMFCGFRFDAVSGFPQAVSLLSPYFLLLFAIGAVISAPVSKRLRAMICGGSCAKLYAPAAAVGTLLLFVLCILALSTDTYNPFIYFRF